MIINNISKKIAIATEAKIADNFITRLKGLLGTDHLKEGSALIIRPCNGIHTLGMKYSIDVIFIDKSDKVIKIVSDMPSRKISTCNNASYVIETPSGVIRMTNTTIGDIISIL
ncbi:MAG: DUF192 domain-containing protein [Acidaminococcaceae bacterium]